jgi:hypothetical protein
VAVCADEQQVGLVLFEELYDFLVGVTLQQLEVGLRRVILEIGARLGQRALAEIGVARAGNDGQ